MKPKNDAAEVQGGKLGRLPPSEEGAGIQASSCCIPPSALRAPSSEGGRRPNLPSAAEILIQKTLLSSLRDIFLQFGLDKTYWIAYSGGLDSHVLFFLSDLLRSELAIKLHAIHINHGLSLNSMTWASHCKQVCKEKNIDFIEHTIRLELNPGESLEEAAREKRYAFFAECLGEGDILLTAHHQEDQAETVLLQLLRGAGLKGLAAMPVIKPFARGFHCRPFLTFPRAMLQQIAQDHQLRWIDDESNNNIQFSRNFIRHEILPILKKRWPSATTTMARSAKHCAESQELLEEFTTELCSITKGTRDNTLSVAHLQRLSSQKQRFVLRAWIRGLGYPLPNLKKMSVIQNNVLTAARDRMPCVSYSGIEIRRYRDDLYLMRSSLKHDHSSYQWNMTQPLLLPGIGLLHATLVVGKGLRADFKTVAIRFRQGGEKVEIPGRDRHTLKNLLQSWHVLPWERDRLPLIFVENRLIGVVGYFINASFAAKSDEMGYEIWLEKW